MKLHHKTPLPLVLGILLNIVLIVIFELLVLYRFPAQPTPALLAKVDARYENCQVYPDINMSSDRGIRFHMVKTADGQTDLVPIKQHAFVPSRTQLYPGKIIENLDLSQAASHRSFVGLRVFHIMIENGQVSVSSAGGTPFLQAALSKYLGLGAVLAFVELLILEKLRGNLE